MLRSGEPTLLILANKATRGRALALAGQVAGRAGCRVAGQFFTARAERGAGRTPLERIPYSVAPALAYLKDFKHLITVETTEPVAFFSYPGQPSQLKAPGTLVHSLVEADEDSEAGLAMLLDALGGGGEALVQQRVEALPPSGPLTPGRDCSCARRRDAGRVHRGRRVADDRGAKRWGTRWARCRTT